MKKPTRTIKNTFLPHVKNEYFDGELLHYIQRWGIIISKLPKEAQDIHQEYLEWKRSEKPLKNKMSV
jgi:hypothetical protein